MPRRMRLRRHESGWTADQRRVLVTGHDFFDCLPAEHRQQAWNDMRDEIMTDWLKDHPGTRPVFWWQYDAPEPRRRMDGGRHPFDDPRYRAEHDTFCGIPRWQREIDRGATYETQEAYLRRLSLLTPTERKALSKETIT